MSKKIIVSLIIILPLVSGGFFYFLRTTDILSNNPFLASLARLLSSGDDQKKSFSLSEEEFFSLKQRITFLEESLEAREEELENLDDLTEKFEILGQKITEIEAEMQVLAGKISETQRQEETAKGEELAEEEVEDSEEAAKEVGQEIGQKPCERIAGVLPSRNQVIINEVTWMGSQNSATDEWIELKNISGQEINLNGWQLLDKDQQIKIIFNKQHRVLANGFLLLERMDDESVPGIAADLIYTGTLSNTNEALYLFDENCYLQDMVEAEPNWPAGDNVSKRTMERKTDLTWQTSLSSGGTPKAPNSSGYFVIPVTPTGGGGAPPPPTGPTYCSQVNLGVPAYLPVILNEIAWMGTQTPYTDEWFELKNISENNISLDGWQILDKAEQIKIIFENTNSIPAGGFYLLERTDDDSVPNVLADKFYTGPLGDTDESFRLFNQNCNLIDEVLANPDWPAGNKDERRSMERSEDLSWHTYFGEGENGIMGTPKAENSQPPLPLDTTPPTRTDGLPAGTLSAGTIETTISLTTDEIATCKYSINPDQDYDLMTDTFLTTNGTSHSVLITGLTDGTSYNYYVRCVDVTGNKNTDDFTITFNVAFLQIANHLVINEVEYDARQSGNDKDYEWFELYNPTDSPITLTNWTITDNTETDTIPELTIFPQIFAVVAASSTGFAINYPEFSGTIVYISDGNIGNGLSNTGDKLILKDASGNIINQMSYGTDTSVLNPSCTDVAEGHSLERSPVGKDTDTAADFIDQINPTPGSI